MKRSCEQRKVVDGYGLSEHDEGGSKRFEEQQAGGNVADLER
jgi:hypothetical protein